jgi:para-nitrobenzyl esterase
MKPLLVSLALMVALPAAWAQEAAAPAPPQTEVASKYSIKTSTLGQLLDNPQTKALFEKYFPEVAHHPQINEGLDLTLPDVVQYLPDVVTPEKLAAMDADLKIIP